jgi:hypothetical protein
MKWHWDGFSLAVLFPPAALYLIITLPLMLFNLDEDSALDNKQCKQRNVILRAQFLHRCVCVDVSRC